ncbi:hypothetical protein [Botrimarina sp.]|uniref:hypothetical protein n=1 Tax=Botrimarina sp. TaxID=2795802 RepID=UPI0032EBF1EC
MTTTASARGTRRRRLLHEGSTAPQPGAPPAPAEPSGEKVRYTPGDESVSFAVARGVMPRSLASVAALLAGGAAVAAALGWLDSLFAADAGASLASVVRLGEPGTIGAWWESLMWLAVAGQAVLLFGLRRHRTDDVGGAYRWWLVVAVIAAGMSLSAATHAHAAAAQQLAELTGASALRGAAVWWLAPALLTTLLLAVRSFAEVKESRVSAALAAAAGVAAVAAGLAAASVLPLVGATPAAGRLVGPLVSMLVPVLALASLLAYSRRILMEASGRIAPPAKPRREPKAKRGDAAESPAAKAEPGGAAAASRETDDDDADHDADHDADAEPTAPRLAERTTRPSRKADTKKKQRAAAAESDQATQWVDGADGYQEEYEDGPERRRPSKAERKRLRREKARRAA